ncbi:MAG: hypothetical protein AAF909_12610 [Pseudomonadota bacterium]
MTAPHQGSGRGSGRGPGRRRGRVSADLGEPEPATDPATACPPAPPPQEDGRVDLRDGFDRLRAIVLERLIDVLENGVPVQKPDPKSGCVAEIGRAPAPPAYLSAAIRFLKDNGTVLSPEGTDDLEAFLAELPSFDDDEDEEGDGEQPGGEGG